MPKEHQKIVIDYYSDVLCVWAWIAQPRLEQLEAEWGSAILVRHRFVDVFGDAHGKISKQWGEQEGFTRFGKHVRESAAGHEHTQLHADLWRRVRPCTSQQAHLLLKATALVAGAEEGQHLARTLREAFFCQGADIGDLDQLLEIATSCGLPGAALHSALRSGEAMAALSSDQRSAQDLGVRGSPTWVLNDGRQMLYGNVGYRILQANIEELLRQPTGEASWC